MTAWLTITDAMTDPDAPLTAELAKAWWKNHIASAEGHDDAPVLCSAWHPYNKVTNGDANTGKFYDFATDGSVASAVTPNFADGWEYQIAFNNLQHSGGAAQNLLIELYRATSAAYAGAVTALSGTTSGEGVYGHIDMHGCRASRRYQTVEPMVASNTTPSDSALRSDMSSAQKVGKARVSFAASNITAGKLYLYRRKAFYE